MPRHMRYAAAARYLSARDAITDAAPAIRDVAMIEAEK